MGTDAEAIRKWQEDHADEIIYCEHLKARLTPVGCELFQKPSKAMIGAATNITRNELRARMCNGCERNIEKADLKPVGVFRHAVSHGRKVSPLVRARQRTGLTKEEVSDLLGIDLDGLGRFERGDEHPSKTVKDELSRFYGIPWSELEGK